MQLKKTEYFLGLSSQYDPQQAINNAIVKRDKFISTNAANIEEIVEENIQVDPYTPQFNQYYCVISLTYYPKP